MATKKKSSAGSKAATKVATKATTSKSSSSTVKYGDKVVDSMGRVGVAKFDSNTGKPLPVPSSSSKSSGGSSVPAYGDIIVDSMGREGVAKFDSNTGLPLPVPTSTTATKSSPTPKYGDTIVDTMGREGIAKFDSKTGLALPVPTEKEEPAEASVTEAPATEAGTTEPTVPSPVAPPLVSLQPGSPDKAAVTQLQNYLVANGYMTQQQMNTGPGIYGPQTQAAVLAMQKKLGIDYSSGPGYFGPKTMAAIQGGGPAAGTNPSGITSSQPGADAQAQAQPEAAVTDPYSGLDPIGKQVKMYTDAYKALGLADIKTQFEDTLEKQKDLEDELADKVLDINNDPWLSEGIRIKRIEKLEASYDSRLKAYTNLADLYDSLYKQGLGQVETIVSGANADIVATNNLVQKQNEAAAALAKDNVIQSVGGRELLINKRTGEVVADLGPVTRAASSGGGGEKSTLEERTASALSAYASKFVPGAKLPSGIPVLDVEGFLTPEAFKAAIADAVSNGITRQKFLEQFGSYIVGADGKVSSRYGLTPAEMKLIGATVRE